MDADAQNEPDAGWRRLVSRLWLKGWLGWRGREFLRVVEEQSRHRTVGVVVETTPV